MSSAGWLALVATVGASACFVPKDQLLRQKSETDTCYEALTRENERKKELDGAVVELERAVGELAAERKKLASEKGELQGTLGSLEEEVGKRLAEVQRLAAEKDRLEAERAVLTEKTETYDALVTSLQQEMKDKLIEVKRSGQRITVAMSDRVLFDSGSAELNDSGKGALKKIADVLGKIGDRRIDVEGHTDNVPISGALATTFPTNWELSSARSVNVVRFLEDSGVDPAHMAAVAKSKFWPAASNNTPRGRQLNRRIDLVLTPWEGRKS